MIFDQISDMFVRIKNANSLNYSSVLIPFSKLKLEIVKILKNEGFIDDYYLENENVKKPNLVIKLKYGLKNEKVISGMKRISKPSLRVYVNSKKIPSVFKGSGIAIISTSKGLMTDHNARKLHIGGEVIVYIW